jgi:mevalonate kinase
LLAGALHPESPGGRVLGKKQNGGIRGDWFDPHKGQGGFGASTAQYIIALAAEGSLRWEPRFESLAQMVDDYRRLIDGRASGADLVSQLCGQCTWWSPKTKTVHINPWPWEELDFHLYRTGNKVKTHEHVEEVTASPDWRTRVDYLTEIAFSGLRAWEESDADDFVEATGRYAFAMNDMDLVCDETRKWLSRIDDMSEVLVAKGCGALGADVILTLLNPQQGPFLKSKMKKLGLEFVADSSSLTQGVSVDVV